MRVLVTGATGFVGRAVCAELARAGHTVRALARGDAGGLPPGSEIARGDVGDLASLAAAASGCDACVHLVAIIVERAEHTFARVNVEGTANVVEALAEQGVRRLVHVSALGAAPDERFPYLRSKWLAEETVARGAADWTILRPSVLFGPGAGFFRPIVWTLRWMPVYPLPAGGRTRFQPLDVADLARAVASLVEGGHERARLEIGGPEILSFREIVEVVMRALSKRRALVRVPLWTARPFASIQERRNRPLVTNQQLDMVVLDNVAAEDSFEQAFGFEPRPFEGSDLRWLALL